MKKIGLIVALLLCGYIQVSAQLVNREELEYLKQNLFGKESWTDIAVAIASHLTLDKNGVITYQKVVEMAGRNKNDLFATARHWATMNFNGSDCDVRMIDKESGCIIVQGYVNNVAENIGWINEYNVRIRPVLKIEVKDGKIRLSVTQSSYDVRREQSAGLFREHKVVDEHWDIKSCYPFVKDDGHPKTSAKALVMTHLCASLYIKRAEEALRHSATQEQNEEDW